MLLKHNSNHNDYLELGTTKDFFFLRDISLLIFLKKLLAYDDKQVNFKLWFVKSLQCSFLLWAPGMVSFHHPTLSIHCTRQQCIKMPVFSQTQQ